MPPNVHDFKEAMKLQVQETTSDLTITRSHLLEDYIRGAQSGYFS